ncbi:MAG: nitroreductase family deazaflavin-dependent oxidoreductase [Polyangiaceae bacterium]|nr:nitroreductase family deazaflavin-dependent oxidoreductase [Polyangiaceae bacterium]
MSPRPKPEGLDKPIVSTIIQRMSKANVWLYQKTGGALGGTWRVGAAFPRGVPVCLLTTTGRKSGEPRTAPLLYIEDGESIVVVGSQGGLPKHPQWYLNLLANPRAKVQLRSRVRDVIARVATPEERARLWPRLVSHYADFESYQAWTDREIPVVLLEPA